MPSIAEVARAARPWWTVVLLLGHVRVAHAQECPAVRHDLGAPSPSAAAGGEAEGPRLEAVDFVGNRALGDARLARRMWLKPRGAWWRRGADV